MSMRTQSRRLARNAAGAGMAVSFLAAIAILAGCGETATTSGSSSEANSTKVSTGAAGAASAAGDTSASRHAAHPAASRASSGSHRHRAKAQLVLPGPNSRPAPKLTPEQRASVSIADITLSSPAITQAHNASTPVLARRYTCHGADQSPPLRWTGVPSGTKELALFVMSVKPVAGKLFFDWAVAKVDPALKGIGEGSPPAGAVVGRGSGGREAYSICPSGGSRESYAFVLYALPRSLAPRPGFDPASLRRQAMSVARHTGLLVGTYG